MVCVGPFDWNPNGWSEGLGEYRDLPVVEVDDQHYTGLTGVYAPSEDRLAFESACRTGDLPALEAITSTHSCTPAFLNNGVVITIRTGHVDLVDHLLRKGAPIVRSTADNILYAPADKQIPIGEVLLRNGWDPNTPNIASQYLLPRVLSNVPLLRWLLTKAGANPNIGKIGPEIYDFEGRETNGSCEALSMAAYRGHVEAVSLLLDAGANINNGFPLHDAAGGTISWYQVHRQMDHPRPSSEKSDSPEDEEYQKNHEARQIQIMDLLVQRGADINLRIKVIMGSMSPPYPILRAISVKSVARTRWLLEHGANPWKRAAKVGPYGNAMDYAKLTKNEELIRVVQEGMKAGRWVEEEEETA